MTWSISSSGPKSSVSANVEKQTSTQEADTEVFDFAKKTILDVLAKCEGDPKVSVQANGHGKDLVNLSVNRG